MTSLNSQRSSTFKVNDMSMELGRMNASGWRCIAVTYIGNDKVLCIWEK